MKDIVIVAAKRTAIGAFNGSLSQVKATTLGAETIKSVLEETNVDPKDINEVILGQVLVGGEGQNTARQAAMLAGIPKETAALQINQVCGSGLRAVAMGAQSLLLGDSDVAIVGGQENMSLSKHAFNRRSDLKMGNFNVVDTMITDGLWDAFNDYHMGVTAENLANKWFISREEQDEFALHSQQKASKAQKEGKFVDEITPITIKRRKDELIFKEDEYIRGDTSLETLGKLRPAFAREDGSVTAGNASGINDGAAILMLMTAEKAQQYGLKPLAKFKSWATAGVDPQYMGEGPIYSTKKALQKAGWDISELDLIEANEAFAAQAITVNKELGWDLDKVNVNGGAIALGHPIGASGARILVTLLHEMVRRDVQKGLATLCVGGGMGVSLCVER